jgi:tRNA(Ile)-lysidine synthase
MHLIPRGGHVVVGLSGGPDSLCLFHVLLRLRDACGFTVSAVHVNHGLRPGAADADQFYVESLCAGLSVPLAVRSVDVAKMAWELGETPEEAGRTARYRAFDEEALAVEREAGLSPDKIKIAVAQNRNDQAETVLMRLIRGSGPDGLAGIPYRRADEEGYEVIRPLLAVDRNEIEDYCADNDLHPRRDHTNAESRYYRNRIRLGLLPLLRKEYNASIDDALIRLSRVAGEDKDFFDTVVRETIEAECEFREDKERMSARISLPLLAETHPAIRHRLIIGIFREIGLVQDIEAAHILAADRLLEARKTGKSVDFPAGYRLEISYDTVLFNEGPPPAGSDEIYELDMRAFEADRDVSILFRSSDLRFRAAVLSSAEAAGDGDSASALLLDFDALQRDTNVLTLRTRRNGDRISPMGMDGSKKLQDMFVDMKIPRDERERVVLLAAGSEVLWIPERRRTRKYAVDARTERVLVLRVVGEIGTEPSQH